MADEQIDPQRPQRHDEIREQIAAYALGVLDGREQAAVETHLRGCVECAGEAQALGTVADSLAYVVPDRQPPPELRRRVLAAIQGGRPEISFVQPEPIRPHRSPALGWLLAAASVAAVAIGLYAVMLRREVTMLEDQLAESASAVSTAERQAAEAGEGARVAQQTMAILTAPDVMRVDLAGQPPQAASSAGRAFWSRSRGLVFTATNLPAPPTGRVYQLWVVPQGAPISIGLLMPDASGSTTLIAPGSDLPPAIAIAVTLEPEGGVPAPTGEKYLVGML